MIRKQINNIEWLEYNILQDFKNLKHAVVLRRGGCSQGEYGSLNLSPNVKDEQQNVFRNQGRAASIFEVKRLSWCAAYHGSEVVVLNQKNKDSFPKCDGIATDEPHIGLAITHADCQAAIFYDPVSHAIANVHAGWRGSVQNIYLNTIRRMQASYGSKPENMIVCISPSLGPQSAEFKNYRSELPEEFWCFQVKPTYFDFWAISEYQLMQAGIQQQHIEIAKIDTYTHAQDFFSYRREKVTGRNATIIMLGG